MCESSEASIANMIKDREREPYTYNVSTADDAKHSGGRTRKITRFFSKMLQKQCIEPLTAAD